MVGGAYHANSRTYIQVLQAEEWVAGFQGQTEGGREIMSCPVLGRGSGFHSVNC